MYKIAIVRLFVCCCGNCHQFVYCIKISWLFNWCRSRNRYHNTLWSNRYYLELSIIAIIDQPVYSVNNKSWNKETIKSTRDQVLISQSGLHQRIYIHYIHTLHAYIHTYYIYSYEIGLAAFCKKKEEKWFPTISQCIHCRCPVLTCV